MLKEKVTEKLKNKDIKLGLSRWVCARFGFDSKILRSFRIRVEKIMFKTQIFQADSDRIFETDKFLAGLVPSHVLMGRVKNYKRLPQRCSRTIQKIEKLVGI